MLNAATFLIVSESTAYEYDLNNRLLTETKASGGDVSITNYVYDDNGNQVMKYYGSVGASGGTAVAAVLNVGGDVLDMFAYDGMNRLISAVVSGIEAEYAYKSDGLRISKTVNGVTIKHVWDGSNICLELDGNNAVIAKYLRGLGLLAAESGGVRTYYLYNAHGDVVQITNTSGAVVRNYQYDAFGNEKSPDPNDGNAWRFCGEYFDRETGTVYLRARNYDPRIGRFTSQDPISDGLNWYTYCGNNPVRFVDPSGQALQLKDTPENSGVILTNLQLLTNDTLYVENGKVYYTKATGELTFSMGTELIRQIIDHKKTTTIVKKTDYASFRSSNADASSPLVILGFAANVTIHLDFGNMISVLTEDGLTSQLRHIELGHELIHALEFMNGKGGTWSAIQKVDYSYYYNGEWHQSSAKRCELNTVGIPYFINGYKYPYQYYIRVQQPEYQFTENGLRAEEGLPMRVKY